MGSKSDVNTDFLKTCLDTAAAGNDLPRESARKLFELVMQGEAPPPLLGAILCAITEKGEAVDEIVGAVEAMRGAMVPVRCDRPCIDTCGTGGDGISTFNVSTTAAIIAAAAGAVVAKHGNRTNSRASGSAEVIRQLGVNIDAPIPVLERCLEEAGIAFLFAPNLHPAMKHAAAVRKAIGRRTIFNLLGPLCNPAGARRQIVGVSKPEHLKLIGRALADLDAEKAWVVHGANGLCDLSVTGASQIAEVQDGQLRTFTASPADADLPSGSLKALLVTSPAESAATVIAILRGDRGTPRDHALLNAAAALVVADCATDLKDGVEQAGAAVDSGRAMQKLDALARLSQG